MGEYFYQQNYDRSLLDLQETISRTGALPCFCDEMAAEGHPKDEYYTSMILGVLYKEKICE